MLSFQGQYTQCQNLTQDTTADALTFFKTSLNTGQRILESELGSFYTEETASVTTIASTSTYKTPADFIRLKKAYITIDDVRYVMDEAHDEEEWQVYKRNVDTVTSDTLFKIFVRRDNFEVYPTPATDDLTITLIYEAGNREQIADDYTTGTITTLANGAAAVTAADTTFTSAMAGRYLKVTSDGVWYKIATFGTTTTLTLDKNYEGLSIASGTEVYIIGDMPITPEPTHQIPCFYAAMQYYMGFKQSISKAEYYRKLYESNLKRAKATFGRRYSSKYIPGRSPRPVNSNWYPRNMS